MKRKKKVMHRFLITLLAMLMLAGCTAKEKAEAADLDGYTDTSLQNHAFLKSDVRDMLGRMKNKESFAVFFGFADCPWCQEALPVLNEAARETDIPVYYINTRPDASVTNNTEIPDYGLLYEAVGDTFGLDQNGNHRLYVPFVLFVNKGETVMSHEGTLADHDAHERAMTDTERQELLDIYRQGFGLLK